MIAIGSYIGLSEIQASLLMDLLPTDRALLVLIALALISLGFTSAYICGQHVVEIIKIISGSKNSSS